MRLPYVGIKTEDVYPLTWRPESLRQAQEVHQQYVPLLREYRFRMELHTKCWLRPVCERHDLAFVRTRCHREMRRACLVELNNKRMVAPNTKRGSQILEQSLTIMRDIRGPTVHGATCTRHASAENASDALVTEANAENWDATRKLADDGHRYSGLDGRAGTGGDDHCTRPQPNKVPDADHVVPDHLRCLTKPLEIAGNVEDEGVVIVDDHNQKSPDRSARNASKMRCALASVSSYSASGSDIAVMPLPA